MPTEEPLAILPAAGSYPSVEPLDRLTGPSALINVNAPVSCVPSAARLMAFIALICGKKRGLFLGGVDI